MNFRLNSILVCILYVFAFGCSDSVKVYHIDNQADFDQYKNKMFRPGSEILFAKGRVFNGHFTPKGSGTSQKPIVINAYDHETGEILRNAIDDKPVINGNGKYHATLELTNTEFWEISNLEITNTDGTRSDQGMLRGINILAKDSGIMEDIIIKNNYVHDVNGAVAGKGRGGIFFQVTGDSLKTKFNHVRIVNNIVKDVGGIGISNRSSWGSPGEERYYPWTDYIIRGNRIERSGRNAIIIRNSKHPIVEYNVVSHSTRYSKGHSIFNFNTIDCVVQYNEVYGNTGDPGQADHGAFDADYNSEGTIIQYNYSHDNNWFCGIMRRKNNTVTIRYNISQNELLGAYFYGFPGEEGVKNVKIYNNTHYFKAGIDAKLFVQTGRHRVPIETTFKNNIFYFTDPGRWGAQPAQSCRFENNLFYNLEPQGKNAVTADPMFINPGKEATDIDMKDANRLSGYRLRGESPAINAGVAVDENGSKDFWGNPLYNGPADIGAQEYSK